MRAAIFNPYLDTMGGGERYTAEVAKIFLDKGFRTDIEWSDKGIKKKLEDRFGLDLALVNIVSSIEKGDGYDYCFWVSDGSIPLLHARKNFLHFQVPFSGVEGRSLLNKMKLFRINKVICNSYFTKKFIDKEYGLKSIVIYPPVDVDKYQLRRKENLILSVGRFSQLMQSKRQDVLIKAFKKFYALGYKKWRLILAGGIEVGAEKFLAKLKKEVGSYPIEIMESPPFDKISKLYAKAKVFWSAAGYKIDENKKPEKTEHFGITVVEAMAAGCVPVVFFAGGHKEIIEEGKNGFFFKTISELIEKTNRLLDNKDLYARVSKNSINQSKNFSCQRFKNEFNQIL